MPLPFQFDNWSFSFLLVNGSI
jgi:hypothetical protein